MQLDVHVGRQTQIVEHPLAAPTEMETLPQRSGRKGFLYLPCRRQKGNYAMNGLVEFSGGPVLLQTPSRVMAGLVLPRWAA